MLRLSFGMDFLNVKSTSSANQAINDLNLEKTPANRGFLVDRWSLKMSLRWQTKGRVEAVHLVGAHIDEQTDMLLSEDLTEYRQTTSKWLLLLPIQG